MVFLVGLLQRDIAPKTELLSFIAFGRACKKIYSIVFGYQSVLIKYRFRDSAFYRWLNHSIHLSFHRLELVELIYAMLDKFNPNDYTQMNCPIYFQTQCALPNDVSWSKLLKPHLFPCFQRLCKICRGAHRVWDELFWVRIADIEIL